MLIRSIEVDLRELVERELTAQGARPQDYRIEGPELPLTPKAAENLALALHELTTNSLVEMDSLTRSAQRPTSVTSRVSFNGSV